jgi:hypothetical protein
MVGYWTLIFIKTRIKINMVTASKQMKDSTKNQKRKEGG